MEQATLLAQLSREELYAIYQFLLLESRSPQEIPRNAQKEQMLDLLAQTLTLEEAQYCLEFFENYDFYEVPVLKWEMIDALPDDLLCALHSIYLDSIDFPETHQELVDSLSQSNYFLKEDARKFYLWFHYFRERILWEDPAPAQPGYNATVRYDLEEMGVADSFTMENYGDLLAEDAGLQGGEGGTDDYLDAPENTAEHPGSSASLDDLETASVPQDMYDAGAQAAPASMTMEEGTGVDHQPHMAPDAAPQTDPQPQPVYDQGPLQTQPNPPVNRQTLAYEPISTHVQSHDGPTMAEIPQPPGIGKSEPELTPLQQKLLASLQAEGGNQRETVNQTIEINSFNLEAYMLEQEEAEAAARAAAGPSLAEIRDEMATHDQATVMGGAPPSAASYPSDGPSVIVDIPSEVVDGPMIDRTQGSKPPPPPPGGQRVRPVENSSSGNVRSTMVLDASAIITDDMQEMFAQGPGAKPGDVPRQAPPPPPPGRQQKLDDLKTIDIDSARDFVDQRPPTSDSEEEIEELEPIEVLEEDELIEELDLASSDAIPAMDPDMMGPEASNRPPQPPQPPPAPRKKRKRPAPRVPTRTGAGVEPEQLEAVTTVLYRTALLGATYARPQIRAIRIYIQKVLECSPEQLRLVRDTLKRLQAEDFPLVPPPLEQLGQIISIVPYAARLQLVHSAIFLLGCKTLQNLDRYRDFLIDLAVELKLDPADISLFDLFGIVEEEIQLGVKDCLELFGLEDGASEGSIRKAHRAKVRLYHPDQYHSKGPEFVRLAERKMKESNMALEILLHRFNM